MKPTSRRKPNHPSAFGTGLIALDLVVSANDPASVRAWAGGTCGNVLTILSYLGWDAYPIACLNEGPASVRIKDDLKRWGVHLDYIGCEPRADAPIIVQEIRRQKNGVPTHRFRWSCLNCGHWLPSYRAVTLDAAEGLATAVETAQVFFLDRVSPAALDLASKASAHGAIVFFEPSGGVKDRLFSSALSIAHVVKYAEQRIGSISSRRPSKSVLLEVKTQGSSGLSYRSWLPKASTTRWEHVTAVGAPVMADTCGAGDWCTAGILSGLAKNGMKGLLGSGTQAIRDSLRYGQILAAWNCGFEGARGGMYSVDATTLARQVARIAKGENKVIEPAIGKMCESDGSSVRCPACQAAS